MYIVDETSVVVAIVPVAILSADGNDARWVAAVASCLVFDSMGRIDC